jgi:hypothetical protein
MNASEVTAMTERFNKTLVPLIGVISLAAFAAVHAADEGLAATEPVSVDAEVQDLKAAVLDLNRELFMLEEELLYPANTQIAVFLSMDVGEFFTLDSVELEVDGKEVNKYLYTEREVQALYRGGVQRLFLGNLKAGEHEIIAFFTGVGPSGRDYRRGATLEFDKGIGAKFVELKISDRVSKQQPEFLVTEWE